MCLTTKRLVTTPLIVISVQNPQILTFLIFAKFSFFSKKTQQASDIRVFTVVAWHSMDHVPGESPCPRGFFACFFFSEKQKKTKKVV